MKNLFFILMAGCVICFFNCSPNSEKAHTEAQLKGKLSGGAGEMIFVNKIIKGRARVFDTIMIAEDSTFSHEFKEALPLDYYILSSKNRKNLQLIMDSTSNILIEGNYIELDKATSKGSSDTEVYTELKEIVLSGNKELLDFDSKIKNAESVEDKKSLGAQKTEAKNAFKKTVDAFINDHQDSPGLSALFDFTDFSRYPDQGAQVINSLAKVVSHTSYYETRAKHMNEVMNLTNTKSPDSGKMAPEINLKDPDGITRKLSDLKGSVVLIDFWASWCGPCRRENPNVVNAYNKYHDLGFDVMSVSLDNSKDKWTSAIIEDGLIWENHVSDLKKWETPYKDIYKFSGIPHTVLVDREGKIIKSKIRGAQLELMLEEIFGF